MSEEIIPVDTKPALSIIGSYGDDQGRRKTTEKVKKAEPIVDVEAVAQELNNTLRMMDTKIAFSVDRSTSRVVISVINAETQEVIRQIPPDDMLHLAARIKELLGVIFDATA
jgi:flagellar protein FlaG